jgi:hypothetical protein
VIKIKDIKRKTTNIPIVPWPSEDRMRWDEYVSMYNLRAIKRGDHESSYVDKEDAISAIRLIDGSVMGHTHMTERNVFVFGLEAWQRIARNLRDRAESLSVEDFLTGQNYDRDRFLTEFLKAEESMHQHKEELLGRAVALEREIEHTLNCGEDSL